MILIDAMKLLEQAKGLAPDASRPEFIELIQGQHAVCVAGEGGEDLIKSMQKRIDRLNAEKEIMLAQMHGDCGTCRHKRADGGICAKCLSDEGRSGWEYEGSGLP